MEVRNGHAQTLRASHGPPVAVSSCGLGTGMDAAADTWRLWRNRIAAWLRSEAVYSPMRPFSFFLAFFAAFFSFGVIPGCFFASLLLFCSLPMTFTQCEIEFADL